MKNQKKVIKIDIEMFRRSVIVFFGQTTDEVIKWIKDHIDDQKTITQEYIDMIKAGIDGPGDAFMYPATPDGPDALIYMHKIPKLRLEYGSLYHELIHAVDHLAKRIDENCFLYDKNGHSETRAYMYQYLVNTLNGQLWPLPTKTLKRSSKVIKNKPKKQHEIRSNKTHRNISRKK